MATMIMAACPIHGSKVMTSFALQSIINSGDNNIGLFVFKQQGFQQLYVFKETNKLWCIILVK